jgi:hypothetical protein
LITGLDKHTHKEQLFRRPGNGKVKGIAGNAERRHGKQRRVRPQDLPKGDP